MNLKMTPARKTKAEGMLRAGKTVREVATALKVSVPTIYYHFSGGARAMTKTVKTRKAPQVKKAA